MAPRASLLPVLLLIGTLARPLAAQGDDARWLAECRSDNDERYCEVRQFDLPARASLSVTPGENGGVEVFGSDGSTIVVHARIQASAPTNDDARALAARITIDTSGALTASGPDGNRRWSVNFVILVPRHTNLVLRAYNGPVSVTGVTGRMDLSVKNGPLSLEDVGGDITARAVNGPLFVELGGTHWVGIGLDAETVNGPLELAIPSGYSAQLETGTMQGPMDLEFPLTTTFQDRMPSRITATLGSGGAPVRAVTTNGPATIRRK